MKMELRLRGMGMYLKIECEEEIVFSINRDGWNKTNDLEISEKKGSNSFCIENLTDEELRNLLEIIKLHLEGL